MILVIGSAGSGKREFVKTLGYAETDMTRTLGNDAPVLYDLQSYLFNDPLCGDAILPQLLKKEVVICDEVGSGVIPVDAKLRRGRENTGRLCILLAKEATAVVRLVCGIPTVIKGAL